MDLINRISALTRHTPAQSKADKLESKVDTEATIAEPFQMTAAITAPARRHALLLPADDRGAIIGTGVKCPALPVGDPCTVTASLQSTAPCQVRFSHKPGFTSMRSGKAFSCVCREPAEPTCTGCSCHQAGVSSEVGLAGWRAVISPSRTGSASLEFVLTFALVPFAFR